MEKEIDNEIKVRLGKETADRLNKMTKSELLAEISFYILRGRVQEETIESLENDIHMQKNKHQAIKERLRVMEAHLEQAGNMLEIAIDRWNRYE